MPATKGKFTLDALKTYTKQFNVRREKQKYSFLIFAKEGKSNIIELENKELGNAKAEIPEGSTRLEMFKHALCDAKKCKWGVYEHTTSKKSEIILFAWAPDGASQFDRFTFGSTTQSVKSVLKIKRKPLQCSVPEDITEAYLTKHIDG